MPTREELEQELQIREAEAEEDRKRIYNLEQELLRTQAAAEAAGVALVVKTPEEETRTELAQVRAKIEDDLQALDELRSPPPLGTDVPETPRDIVRANQRERAELQQRMAMANNALSRIAAALKIDRWDQDDGAAIVDKVNALASLEMRVTRKIAELKKHPDPAGLTLERLTFVGALEWVLDANAKSKTPAPLNTAAGRNILFQVHGAALPVWAEPEHTLGYLLSAALGRLDAAGTTPVDRWMIFGEDGARLQLNTTAREYKGTKIVASPPFTSPEAA